MLDRDDGGEALAHVVAGDLGILVLQEVVGLGELVDRAGKRAAETGEMGTAVGVMDRVGVAKDLVVVGIVVLEDDLDVDLGVLFVDLDPLFLADGDGLGVEGGLALVELADEFLDAVLVEVALGLRVGGALVGEGDLQARVEEGEFAQALGDARRLEHGGLLEDLTVGLERDEGAGAAGFADDLELLHGLAALEFHVVHLAVAGDLDLEPLGDGVDALGADAVGAAGELVTALAVLAAGVQRGEHHLNAGNFVLRVDVDRDASAVVADADRAVDVDGDLDFCAMAREMFVDGIIEHLGNAVVQGAFVGAADVHARFFSHRLEALELAQFGGIVGLGIDGIWIARGGFGNVGHRRYLAGFFAAENEREFLSVRGVLGEGFLTKKSGRKRPFFRD